MAVGTGFGQLFRGVGQVGGVAISSAIFQSSLETELRKRIHTPDAEDVRGSSPFLARISILTVSCRYMSQLITRIRQSVRFVSELPVDIQRLARDSYDISLHKVFLFAACSTLMAYLVRLPVSTVNPVRSVPR